MKCKHNKAMWDEWYECTVCFDLVSKKELDALRAVVEAAEKLITGKNTTASPLRLRESFDVSLAAWRSISSS